MDYKIRELLEKIQQFTNKAVKLLQEGKNDEASFFFNLSSSLNAEIALLLKGD